MGEEKCVKKHKGVWETGLAAIGDMMSSHKSDGSSAGEVLNSRSPAEIVDIADAALQILQTCASELYLVSVAPDHVAAPVAAADADDDGGAGREEASAQGATSIEVAEMVSGAGAMDMLLALFAGCFGHLQYKCLQVIRALRDRH